MSDLMSAKQAAEFLHIDESKVRWWCRSRRLTAEKIGGGWIIERRALELFALTEPRKGGWPLGKSRKRPAA